MTIIAWTWLAAWCAPMMPAAALSAGAGILFPRIPLPRLPKAKACPGAVAPATPGPSWPWTPQRDLLFVPTGSASPDYYGGLRPGDDEWSNSVVVLRGKNRRTHLGLPACASRSVGLRQRRPAPGRHFASRWKRGSCGHSGQQIRTPLRPQPRHRQARWKAQGEEPATVERLQTRREPRFANALKFTSRLARP